MKRLVKFYGLFQKKQKRKNNLMAKEEPESVPDIKEEKLYKLSDPIKYSVIQSHSYSGYPDTQYEYDGYGSTNTYIDYKDYKDLYEKQVKLTDQLISLLREKSGSLIYGGVNTNLGIFVQVEKHRFGPFADEETANKLAAFIRTIVSSQIIVGHIHFEGVLVPLTYYQER